MLRCLFALLAVVVAGVVPAAAQCPGGRCPLPKVTAAPAASSPTATAPAHLHPPGPGFRWERLPGVGGSFGGYGWVQVDPIPVPMSGPTVTTTAPPTSCPGGRCPLR